MLIRVVLAAFVCLLFASSSAQTLSTQRKEDLSISKFHNAPVSIPSPEDSVSVPIHFISVVDARPDSSAIGLYQVSKLDPRFIVTLKDFRTESEQYVNKYVQGSKSDSFSVLLVLRKFWISTAPQSSDERKIWDLTDTVIETKIKLFTRMEIYLCKDPAYYILYRFDSVFSADINQPINITRKNKKTLAGILVQDALKTSLSRLTTMNGHWNTIISSKRKFTLQEIESHDRKYFEMPVLKDSLLIPGVYLTYEEFKDNSPSVRDFEVTKDKLNDFISTKEPNGRQVPLSNAWGYCDSSNQVFARLGRNYFRLQRRQNAFYIYGSNQTAREIFHAPGTEPASNPGTNVAAGSIPELIFLKFDLKLKPFQLDWDTGKLD